MCFVQSFEAKSEVCDDCCCALVLFVASSEM